MEQITRTRFQLIKRRRLFVIVGVTSLFCMLGLVGMLRNRPVAGAVTSSREALPDERPRPVADTIDPPRPKRRADPPASAVPGEERRARSSDYNSADKSMDWAIIAATLNGQDAAERRAQALKSQWSECDCRVYPGPGENPKYFVVIGSGLGRNEADRLRDQAISAGLPPDTYVTKLIRSPGTAP